MKNSVKKVLKILLILSALLLIGVAILGYDLYVQMNGSPKERAQAALAIREYADKNYADLNLKIENISYDYKRYIFVATVQSPSSRDTHFNIEFDPSQETLRDNYDSVTSGYSTFGRWRTEYQDLVETALNPYPYELKFVLVDLRSDRFDEEPHIVVGQIELDEEIDPSELGQYAEIYAKVAVDEVSVQQLAEVFITTKKLLQENGIPFYSMGIQIEEKTDADERILAEDILYDEIGEGLKEKIATIAQYKP